MACTTHRGTAGAEEMEETLFGRGCGLSTGDWDECGGLHQPEDEVAESKEVYALGGSFG